MQNSKKIIIFDLDGVLINSIDNMKFTWMEVRRKFELNIPFNRYRENIGLPFLKILQNLKIKKKNNEIKEYYKKISLSNQNKIKIYRGVKKTLLDLKKKYKIAIFTSKDYGRTKKILKKFNIKVDLIVTPEKLRYGKPNPEGINHIIKKFKSRRENCIYIGDSIQDLIAAKKARVMFLFAMWGYGKITFKSNKIKKISEIYKFL